MTTVLLLRHGETDWNAERRIQGWGPVPLNRQGREQARLAGECLASAYDVDRLLTSDLRRTHETAELVGERLGLEPEPDRAWRERDFGVYQGLRYEDAFERHPEFDATRGIVALDSTPERGESMREMFERVVEGWEGLVAAADPDETVVVLTHGGPIYVVLGHVRGRDVVAAVAEGSQSNCALNELRYDPQTGETTVVTENDVSHRA